MKILPDRLTYSKFNFQASYLAIALLFIEFLYSKLNKISYFFK